MFTGLIESLGIIRQKKQNFIVIETKFDDIKIGDSIAVNGVCLTATKIIQKTISFDVMPETFARTNLFKLKINEKVNLERAMLATSRFNGHIVQGHVEFTGILRKIENKDNAKILKIYVNNQKNLENILEKGSIAIDGISLTIMSKKNNEFCVSIIPETWKITNLCLKKIGDELNIETDFLTRAVINKNENNFENLLKNEGFY